MELKNNKLGGVVMTSPIINEEVYNLLNNMFKSKDPADILMGQLMLTKIDVKKSIVYIKRLGQTHSWVMVNRRTKLGRKFIDDSNLYSIQNMNITSFVIWLHKKGWLTSEILKSFQKDLINYTENCNSNSIFKISTEFNEIYSQYLTTNITHND